MAAQAAWLAALCLLIVGGERSTMDHLIAVACAAEEELRALSLGGAGEAGPGSACGHGSALRPPTAFVVEEGS